MSNQNESPSDGNDQEAADPIDREAALIDARSEDAPEKIQALIEHAESEGREVSQEVDSNDSNDEDEPEVLPG